MADETMAEAGEMTPVELKERLDNEHPIVLVDVRQPHEWSIADLPEVGQLRIPLDQFMDRMSELDPDDNIVIYCRSGARSGRAAEELAARGYGQVYNLVGGLLRWREDVDPSVPEY